jgi:hypothetical protein
MLDFNGKELFIHQLSSSEIIAVHLHFHHQSHQSDVLCHKFSDILMFADKLWQHALPHIIHSVRRYFILRQAKISTVGKLLKLHKNFFLIVLIIITGFLYEFGKYSS